MSKVKISTISYLNSLPFLYGLQHYEKIKNQIEIELDYPSECASKLIHKRVDIGLVPISIIPEMKISFITSKYCIGAKANVKSVLVVSDVPIENVKAIYLDYQSRTSVMLTKVLAKNYWRIFPQWLPTTKGYENLIVGHNAGLIIGDRALTLKKRFKYTYDLSDEWQKLTGLPFVFAIWLTNKGLTESFKRDFSDSLSYGIENIDKVLETYKSQIPPDLIMDPKEYLTSCIDYDFDKEKTKAMNLFIKYINELKFKDLIT